MIHKSTVMAIEPIRLAAASHSRSFGPEAAAGVPDQVAYPAEHVVDERPSVTEQDQPADRGAGE